LRPRNNYFAFANEYEYRLKDQPYAWREEREYRRGEIIDLDQLTITPGRGTEVPGRTKTRFDLRGYPMNNQFMADQASDLYEDAADYNEWAEEGHQASYHDAAANFYQAAEARVYSLAPGLSSESLSEIYQLAVEQEQFTAEADHGAAGMDNLREKLVYSVEQNREDPLHLAYLHWLETKQPEKITGKIGQELMAQQAILEERNLEPHIPAVFVFDRGFYGGFETIPTHVKDEDYAFSAHLQGKYRVAKIEYVPAKAKLRTTTPPNILGFKYIYLEPIED